MVTGVPVRGACALGLGTVIAVLAAAGCSSDEGGAGSDATDTAAGRGPLVGGNSGSGESGRSGSGGEAQGVGGGLSLAQGGNGTGPASGGTPSVPSFDECAEEVVTGKLAPLDLFVMLDTSGSMLETTGAGVEKWVAVKQALSEFLNDEGSAGIGVGIQYFPQQVAGAPETCRINADCGAAGPCFLNACAASGAPCSTNDECRLASGSVDTCVPLGICTDDPSVLCREGVARDCVDASGVRLGECRRVTSSYCYNMTECAASAYAAAAVPISALPEGASQLIASIEAQEPTGRTPTGPAIRGALEHSRAWASSHPGHSVVVLLATDGLPTECTPLEINNIARLTASGYATTPSVRTFVVGVFAPTEVDAQSNLDAIAQAGGTESAFVVDTSADVTAQFLAALNEIRGARLGCEFQIPEPTGNDPLDYNLVNVQLASGDVTTPLYFVGGSAAGCDASGGWYYDADPAVAAPSRIIMCPSSCQVIEASAEASVQIQLGCRIRVR